MRRQEPFPAEFYTGACKNDHPRSPANTYIRKRSLRTGHKRECRLCRAELAKQPRRVYSIEMES